MLHPISIDSTVNDCSTTKTKMPLKIVCANSKATKNPTTVLAPRTVNQSKLAPHHPSRRQIHTQNLIHTRIMKEMIILIIFLKNKIIILILSKIKSIKLNILLLINIIFIKYLIIIILFIQITHQFK